MPWITPESRWPPRRDVWRTWQRRWEPGPGAHSAPPGAAPPERCHAGAVFDFHTIMEFVVYVFEIGGVAILLGGTGVALWVGAFAWRRSGRRAAYEVLRHDVGRAILLGLEFLIIADIVKTITVETTMQAAFALGVIVVVRTFLSFSLSIELDGHLPWRRHHDPHVALPQAALKQGEASGRV